MALVLIAVRLAVPPHAAVGVWSLGHLAGGAGIALVVLGAGRRSSAGWTRRLGLTGAVLVQLGVVAAWLSPLDPTRAPSSGSLLLGAGGGVLVALALLGASRTTLEDDGVHAGEQSEDRVRWSRAVAAGGVLGFAATGLGFVRLLTLDAGALTGSPADRLSALGGADSAQLQMMMQMMGGGMGGPMEEMLAGSTERAAMLGTVVPVVVVLVAITPVAIGAYLAAHRSGSVAAVSGFTLLALMPILVSGGGRGLLGAGLAAGAAGWALVRLGDRAGICIPAIVLGGAALGAGVAVGPVVVAVALYGALLGGLLQAISTSAVANESLPDRSLSW